MRVLLVDDDADLRTAVGRALRIEGYVVETVASASACRDAVAAGPPELLLIDVGLPDGDGIELCRELRGTGDRTPILMLTARAAIRDRVAGLDAGADDYLVKPFALEELRARVRALGRRGVAPDQDALTHSDLTLRPASFDVRRGERQIDLTKTEFALLELLLRHAGSTLTREQIIEQIWGYDGGPNTNALDVYVGYLRRKLEAGGEPRMIHTIRGVGFLLRAR